MKTLIWNKEENSIRGSFVNLVITMTILALIVAGAFFDVIAARCVWLGVRLGGWPHYHKRKMSDEIGA